MTTLTIQSLIQHFEDRMRRINRQDLDDTGREPQFPQMIIYLGDDAQKAHSAVSTGLLQIWPQYQSELKFLWVQTEGEGVSFSELTFEGSRTLSEDGVQELTSSLFGTKMHFSDRSKLLVYYILDTTAFLGVGDLCAWLSQIGKVRELMCAQSTDILDVLFLLLNENLARQKTAARIRDHLSGFYEGNDVRKAVGNVMLLSNRRSDNAILEDWSICHQILSAAIVLSNNTDPRIVSSFFSGSVMTASYAREEKPLSQIGQVVIKGLIDELSKATSPMDVRPLADPRLPEKLGLTQQGTLALLDEYAESNLFALLPSKEQMELFPRRDSNSQTSMSLLSARAFNEYTMGAWEQYLSSIVRKAQEKLSMDSSVRTAWRDAYRALLVENFSREELLYLVTHVQDVEDLLTAPRAPGQDAPVLSAAQDQLKYMLSGDREVVRIFLSALEEQGQAAQDFSDMWNSLLRSMRKVHTVRDNNIATFYDRKVRNFYDRSGAGVCQEFAGMHDTSELSSFLTGTLDRIVDSDEIFSSAFEDELENRLNEEALPTDAKQYIRKKLTGDEVFVYLQTNFDLGEPLFSSILLKTDTPLYSNLYSNLPPTTYYYDTGSSTTAEALVIYEVSAVNLVNGEGL
jgi:hypothetical protein